jgi:uncharacterized protein YlxW (UPF0749 family)
MHLDRSKTHWLLSFAVVCLVMGALLAVQVRSNPPQARLLFSRFGVAQGGPIGALSQVLAATQNQVAEQAEEIAALRKQTSEYERAMAREKDIVKPMAEQLSGAKVALGLTAVEGPGIILEVNDSTLALGEKVQSDLQSVFLVHDFDLLQIANELWAAGAEAVSLNGQRLVGGSPIRCVGPTTQVNGVPITAPYQFIALGDPDTLANSLNLPGGVLDRLRSVKYRIKLEKKPSLVVPAVSTAKKFQHARPVEEADASR